MLATDQLLETHTEIRILQAPFFLVSALGNELTNNTYLTILSLSTAVVRSSTFPLLARLLIDCNDRVNPGNDPFGPALEDLGEQDGTSFVWDTNVASGESSLDILAKFASDLRQVPPSPSS